MFVGPRRSSEKVFWMSEVWTVDCGLCGAVCERASVFLTPRLTLDPILLKLIRIKHSIAAGQAVRSY